MHSTSEMDLHDEAVKVTWCACEHCSSIEPRAMTVVKHHREYTISLHECRNPGPEDALVSGETEHVRRHRSRLTSRVPR
jgi:hypothetical protein